MVLGHHAPQLPLPVLTGVLAMNIDTIIAVDDLIGLDIDRLILEDIYRLSTDHFDWENEWNLQIMYLNFPFLN